MDGFRDAIGSPQGLMFLCQFGACVLTALAWALVLAEGRSAREAARAAESDRRAAERLRAAVEGDRRKAIILVEECRQYARDVEALVFGDFGRPEATAATREG